VLAGKEGLVLNECGARVIKGYRGYFPECAPAPSARLDIEDIGGGPTMNAPCTRKTLYAPFPVGGSRADLSQRRLARVLLQLSLNRGPARIEVGFSLMPRPFSLAP